MKTAFGWEKVSLALKEPVLFLHNDACEAAYYKVIGYWVTEKYEIKLTASVVKKRSEIKN